MIGKFREELKILLEKTHKIKTSDDMEILKRKINSDDTVLNLQYKKRKFIRNVTCHLLHKVNPVNKEKWKRLLEDKLVWEFMDNYY